MKKFTMILALLLATCTASLLGQTESVGDTLGPWSVISFEEPYPYLQIGTSTQNIWQIATPSKSFFNQAYTIPRAILTDSLNTYPAGNHSWFDLYVGNFNSYWYPFNIFIDFRHKFDTDTLHDGGYLEVSWDNGLTFNNILNDPIAGMHFSFYPGSPWVYFGNTSIYSNSMTLFNGEKGFSGNSGGWMHTCVAWYDLPVDQTTGFMDTLILRFNFISDGTPEYREGWMIDEIRIFSIDLGSYIPLRSDDDCFATVIPNPMTDRSTVQLREEMEHVKYRLRDPAGREIMQGEFKHCRNFVLEREGLTPGLYLLELYSGDRYLGCKRIAVIDDGI